MAKFGIEHFFVVILFSLVVVSLGEGEEKEGGKIVEIKNGSFVEIKNGSSMIQQRGEGKLKTEGNYAQISIWYLGEGAPEYLSIGYAGLSYGKWVAGWGDYSTAIGSPNGQLLFPGGELRIAAAGKSGSPTGATGYFDIHYDDPYMYNYKVAHVTFDACYSCGISPFSVQTFLDGYFKIDGQVINGGSKIFATIYVRWIAGTVSAS